eukprot:CAMPEP_0114327962 /NCGR_PEP_ID=MMETSP0101-20121206/100_1 /TAXON_ID=38822 ORGANISM="Pteridomonas danica, Strain PT" /NCGR_SAMPLE_ID=MMETSP0101 /ASSEMBLY_ACC=CAM_ASM_000211 /LENGTH=164 /DNA_ID=CAMNT_0001457147 /DNA_START=2010 /DNA_END=2501 /DNA_ORIENTATION=-
MTGRTNLSAPSGRSMSCPGTPNQRSERPIFSPIGSRGTGEFGRNPSGNAQMENLSVKELKSMVASHKTDLRPGSGTGPETEFRDTTPDINTIQTRVYQLGFDDGMKTAQTLNPPQQSYSGLETTRSARVRLKKIKAQELKSQKIQKRNEEHLAKFIKRNEDQMW